MANLPSVVSAPHSDGGTSPRAVYVNVSAPHTLCRSNYAHGCAVFTGRCRDLSEHQKWRPSGNCSGRRGDPSVTAGEFGEDVEGPAAVLGRGGQVGAHRGEVLSAGEG